MMYKMIEKKIKKQEEELIRLLKRKKRTYQRKKMIIYYLSVGNCKKLIERLNYKIFYYNAGNKRKILEKFVNKKQQMIIATSMFGMGINVADIKVIMHANELKMMLDYAQESKQVKWDEKRNEVMVVWGRIRAAGGKRRGRGGKKNKNKKQMEQKKVVKFLEIKCQRMALDKYLDGKKD